ncbi:hypothetical protein G7077_09405 [Sphingomonas piscis]|uniref:DUF2530 domain-containing protein n=1 Tax=Sphingomonas piscis TaxID=2714943 RepID=A0A6G7YQR8_9SPHN|nr:hypothetical protein [Sphingomonas piscis]QIK79077.1 hypothetical protein G7077_09405 [Sphingomonas piscis]
MRHETVTVDRPGFDFKAAGYLVSIASVILLGIVAWPTRSEPQWHKSVLLAGIATSILGMGFRYLAHLKQRRELQQAKMQKTGG